MYLGIDVGHSVIKAGVYDYEGNELAIEQEKVALISPKKDYYETSMDELWDRTRYCIRKLATKFGNTIKVVGLSGGGNGFYALDSSLNPIGNGITALDKRANYIIEELKRRGEYKILFEKIGMPLLSSFPPILLRWYKDNDRKNYYKIRHILNRKDYVRFRLTGEISLELSDACFGLTNVYTQGYDKEIFELLGVSEMFDVLPELKDNSYDIAGFITDEAEKETYLKRGTPVVAGAHDACCNTLGVGGISNNIMVCGGGTFSINLLVVDKPILNMRWSCENFVKKGKWMLEGSSPTATVCLDWFIKNFYEYEENEARKMGRNIYKIVDEKIVSRKTYILFLPFIMGLIWNYPYKNNVSACFLGIRNEDTKEDMLRSIFEGVTFAHMLHIEEYEKNIGLSEIRFTGGASKSEVWCQMLADVTKKRVITTTVNESGCLGAALLGMLGIKEIKCLEEIPNLIKIKKVYMPKEDYSRKYEIFKESCLALDRIWNELEKLRSSFSPSQ
ncbi:MAG: FGGY-family carbohydrate kinase [Nitrososphaeria archaeon]